MKTYINSIRLRLIFCGFLLLLFSSGLSSLSAQPVLNAQNISLGGGGTAYLTGPESNFFNPANLAIYDRRGTLHFSLGMVGSFFEPVLSSGSPKNQFDRYADIFLPYDIGEQNISSDERNTILDENYTGRNLSSEHLSRADIIWGGLQWNKNEKSYSIALRSRAGSRIEVGKGWYSRDYISQNGSSIRDFTLEKQLQVLHEVSFGFSQEFQFINGLMPRINKLYIGIAPKFVIGGAYENSKYNGRYITDAESNTTYSRSFSLHSSGSYSEMVNSYRNSGDPQSAINNDLKSGFLTDPTGYGAGIDFGLTYVIPLGSDVTLIDKGSDKSPVERSLRFALSITDIGIIRYSSTPIELGHEEIDSQVNSQDPSGTQFIGSAGQLLAFFEDATEIPNPFFEATTNSENSFTTSLPTSINAGAVLDVDRVRLMSDLTLGLNNTAFTNKKLVAHFGLETHPLPFLPIRFGTTLAAGKPLRFGAGTGLKTKYWDFTISTQLLVKSSTFTTDIVGGAVAALQFHL